MSFEKSIWRRNKRCHFVADAISIWANKNKYVSVVYFFLIFIYWTFITFQVHPQRKYGSASVKRHTHKKNPLYVKIQREYICNSNEQLIFSIGTICKNKKKRKRKKLSTLSQQRALCLFTPASLCWKHGPVWVHCTQVGMLVHFPRIFSHSWRISTG